VDAAGLGGGRGAGARSRRAAGRRDRPRRGVESFDRDDPDARIHRRDGRFTADPGFEDHPAAEVLWRG